MSNSGDKEWDKYTDEIRSIASEDLHETRPNRWTGPASTWRKLTAEDRQTYAALEAVRNRDLSVHLYNAFALKRGGYRGGPDAEDVNKETGALAASHDDAWGPDKAWTAWPLSLDRVPPTDFMPRNDDDDEDGRTFRRPVSRAGPGTELEEELSATILRLAKEKFRQRGLGEEDAPVQQAVRSVETNGGEESDISLPKIKPEPQSGLEEEDEEEAEVEKVEPEAPLEARSKRQRTGSPMLIPTVSADDELSYELLRPVTRHLLTKLDKTLTVLHNARVAGIAYGSDSEQEERVEEAQHKSPTNRSKRKIWLGDDEDPEVPAKPTSRKIELHTPQEGETEREMRVRLARKYHRRIPRFSDDEGETTAAETGGSRTDRRQKRTRVTTRSMSRKSPGKPDPDVHRGKRLDDWALRDWSDVLGAAALAGFSPNVIARATQRCADLFGQGMEFNTLAEEPATGQNKRSRTTRYVPGEQVLPTDDEEVDETEGYRSEAEQIRAVSRASSVILDGSLSEEDESAGTTRRSRQRGRGQRSRRSYSVGPSVVRLYCPYPTCSGAINGFSRRSNLKQHLVVAHGKNPDVVSEDEDDRDEVHGAVHVDGFLKPIRPRKGWRGGDIKESNARKQLRGRKKTRAGTPPPRHFYSDDGYYAEVNDDDLIKNEDDQDYV
ncbi:hypothetical protein CONLIGDRAFT_116059 [Coniochaeta ligniaria NRRL 30616]|uniref:Rrn9 domain-containing protein n=1 Tax=Coniochaeta ligniaria NRRL 30616 TaxID=1408157 RepID=A0A1J7J424_9PEZI|nr:hypothetical protein CONLIGDRAFT_116059 [Coniochaeta ligniaria NRRL 30616]